MSENDLISELLIDLSNKVKERYGDEFEIVISAYNSKIRLHNIFIWGYEYEMSIAEFLRELES